MMARDKESLLSPISFSLPGESFPNTIITPGKVREKEVNPRESGEVGSFIYFSSLCHLQQFTLGTR